jgi:mycofactocin system glycosyltransferase
MVHPRYRRDASLPVTVVVPVKDHAASLERLLATVDAEVIVVDDGSVEPLAEATIRHAEPRGPAAARNAGWRKVGTEIVAFLDADAVPEPGWLEPLLAHFADPAVSAVAPRVRSVPGKSTLARYEESQSSLDLGGKPAIVQPGSTVSYVPSAALLVRTDVLDDYGGFDEQLRFGEDVDLIWRLVAAGEQVRYEPSSVVRHEPRNGWRRWLRQRFEYGTAAGPLAKRHGPAITPVRMSVWSALSWAAVAAGAPKLGVATAVVSAALLPRKLASSGVPTVEALRLAASGHLGAGRLLAEALTRTWLPLVLPVLATRRGRLLLAAAAARHLVDWQRERPAVDPVRWCLARIADDAAYGAGVCWGSWRARTLLPLLPELSGLPGKR